MAACFDAGSGEKLWEKRWPVYHTTVPWNRVGWPNPALDPETGYLYVQGVAGLFFCFDSADGRVVWSRSLIEEYGFMEGYGGRTQTPLVDEDRVIVTFASSNWGDQSRPLHRMYAFDKRTGEAIWAASPATSMADKNSQSTPAVAVVGGRRLLIQGNGDGTVYQHAAQMSAEVNFSSRTIGFSTTGTQLTASNSSFSRGAPQLNMSGTLSVEGAQFSGRVQTPGFGFGGLGSFTGTASGTLYGPDAEEIGGVFDLRSFSGGSARLTGAFGGKR